MTVNLPNGLITFTITCDSSQSGEHPEGRTGGSTLVWFAFSHLHSRSGAGKLWWADTPSRRWELAGLTLARNNITECFYNFYIWVKNRKGRGTLKLFKKKTRWIQAEKYSLFYLGKIKTDFDYPDCLLTCFWVGKLSHASKRVQNFCLPPPPNVGYCTKTTIFYSPLWPACTFPPMGRHTQPAALGPRSRSHACTLGAGHTLAH